MSDDHDEIRRLLGGYLLGGLDEADTDRVDAHLRDCDECRTELERLSTDHQAVVRAMYYEGRSVADAARSLSVPEGTVKSRAYYAVRALRTAFEEMGVLR